MKTAITEVFGMAEAERIIRQRLTGFLDASPAREKALALA